MKNKARVGKWVVNQRTLTKFPFNMKSDKNLTFLSLFTIILDVVHYHILIVCLPPKKTHAEKIKNVTLYKSACLRGHSPFVK